MTVNAGAFKQFQDAVRTLGRQARPVDLSGEEQLARATSVFMRKIDAPMAVDLESCIHCGHCADACHFQVGTGDPQYTPMRKMELLRRFYRRELAPQRWLYRLFVKEVTLEDLQEWQPLVYDSCTECGRCGMVCPMGIDIARIVNVMRQAMAEAGLIPDELRAVEHQQTEGSLFGVGSEQMQGAAARLAEMGLEVPIDKERADILVLSTVVDIMMFNDALINTIRIMNHTGLDWTFRSSGFEAANFGFLTGDEELQRLAAERIIREAITIGAKTVIVPECGHAYPALRWEGANVHGAPLPFEVLAISEFIGREIESGRIRLKKGLDGRRITYHDPCKIARHGGVVDEPRTALKALGADYREMDSPGVMNWCCGGGAGVFLLNDAAPLRQRAFEIKMKQVEETGAEAVVLTCGSCRANFLNGAQQAKWETPIESLVELVGANLAE
ncbi:MAG TPA: (Fe-S)-binding protein [Chromatiales bacterium]|nr:(Fe-S)-binding protein [Chromatiales bacterium]